MTRVVCVLLICVLLVVIVLSNLACSTLAPESELEDEWVLVSEVGEEGYITYVYYYHDEEREVGIWLSLGFNKSGIAVLPDSEYMEGAH